MRLVRLSVSQAAVERQIKLRLMGSDPTISTAVWEKPWIKEDKELCAAVRIDLSGFKTALKKGWLLLQFGVQTQDTGLQALQAIYYLGQENAGANLQASATLQPAATAGNLDKLGALTQRWGDDLLRVIWDGVLDCIEAALQRLATQYPNQALTPLGIFSDVSGGRPNSELQIDIQIGA
jgi:hypothetical protein